MPITMRRVELFPDDVNELPRPGTAAQEELIADEEQIAGEDYLDTIRSFDALADQIYGEVARNALAVLNVTGRTQQLRVLDLGSGIALEAHALIKHDISIAELTLSDYSSKTRSAAATTWSSPATRSCTSPKTTTRAFSPTSIRSWPTAACSSFSHTSASSSAIGKRRSSRRCRGA
jgi:hypothetical protein